MVWRRARGERRRALRARARAWATYLVCVAVAGRLFAGCVGEETRETERDSFAPAACMRDDDGRGESSTAPESTGEGDTDLQPRLRSKSAGRVLGCSQVRAQVAGVGDSPRSRAVSDIGGKAHPYGGPRPLLSVERVDTGRYGRCGDDGDSGRTGVRTNWRYPGGSSVHGAHSTGWWRAHAYERRRARAARPSLSPLPHPLFYPM